MKVTVLIAVRNGGDYLRQALESVLAQSFDAFELLVVDDASTDGSVELTESFADPRIRVLRNERNLGQIPSLNRGLREARGTYVARLDHDDLCLPQRLERQVAALDAQPHVALIGTWVDIVEPDGRVWTRIRDRIDSRVEFVARLVVDDVPLAHPSLMFRRDVVLELGGFDERLGAAEDKDLYRRLALAGHEGRIVPETLLVYRRHEGQMTYAKKSLVHENNEFGQERFLAEIAPWAPASSLRTLFAGDARFWDEPPLGPGAPERFLDDLVRRLEFDERDRAVLARALATGVRKTLLAGWSGGASRYGRRSPALTAFAARHGGVAERATALGQPLLAATAPAGRVVAPARRRLWIALQAPSLGRARRALRRSRALRRVYTRLVGGRFLRG